MPLKKNGKSGKPAKAGKPEVSSNPITAQLDEVEGKLRDLSTLAKDILDNEGITSAHTRAFLAKLEKYASLSQEISSSIPGPSTKGITKAQKDRAGSLKSSLTEIANTVPKGLRKVVLDNIAKEDKRQADIDEEWEKIAVKTTAALAAIEEQLPIFLETAKSYLNSSIDDDLTEIPTAYKDQRNALMAEIEKIENRKNNTTDLEARREYLQQINKMNELLNKRTKTFAQLRPLYRDLEGTAALYQEARLEDKDALLARFYAQRITLKKEIDKHGLTAEEASSYLPNLSTLSVQVKARKVVLDAEEAKIKVIIEAQAKKAEAAVEQKSVLQLLLDLMPPAAREAAMQLLSGPEVQEALAKMIEQDPTLAIDNPVVQAVSNSLGLITQGGGESSALVAHSGTSNHEANEEDRLLALPGEEQRALVASALMDLIVLIQPGSTKSVATSTKGISTSTQMALIASVLDQLALVGNKNISAAARTALKEGFKAIGTNLRKLESGEAEIFSVVAQVGEVVHVVHFSLAELVKNPTYIASAMALWSVKVGLSGGAQIITNLSSPKEAAALSLMQGIDFDKLKALQGSSLMAITNSVIAAAASNNAAVIKRITGGEVTASSVALVEQESRIGLGSHGTLSSGAKAGGGTGFRGAELANVLKGLRAVADTTAYFMSPAGQKDLGSMIGHKPEQIAITDLYVLEQAGSLSLLGGTIEIPGTSGKLQLQGAEPLQITEGAPLQITVGSEVGATVPVDSVPSAVSAVEDHLSSVLPKEPVIDIHALATEKALAEAAAAATQKALEAQEAQRAFDVRKKASFIAAQEKGINAILDILRGEIGTEELHHSTKAVTAAKDLLKDLEAARDSYLDALNNGNDSLIKVKENFRVDCEGAMTKAKPGFANDVNWGTYLLNIVKKILNYVATPVTSLMKRGPFFNVRESESTVATRKAGAALNTVPEDTQEVPEKDDKADDQYDGEDPYKGTAPYN